MKNRWLFRVVGTGVLRGKKAVPGGSFRGKDGVFQGGIPAEIAPMDTGFSVRKVWVQRKTAPLTERGLRRLIVLLQAGGDDSSGVDRPAKPRFCGDPLGFHILGASELPLRKFSRGSNLRADARGRGGDRCREKPRP